MDVKKTLFVVVGVVALAFVLVACQPAAAPAPATPCPACPECPKCPAPPTAAPTTVPATPASPAPAGEAKPAAPVAVLEIVSLPANARLPGAITATIQVVTDTAVGPGKATVAMGTSGLTNVPVNTAVRLAAKDGDPKNPAKKYAWTLTGPSGTKAAFKDPAAAVAEFTPDLVGMYKIDVVASNDAGRSPMASVWIHAGTFIGVTAGNCQQCHSQKVEEWAKTGHANILKEEIDLKPTHYTERCVACHSTGFYYPVRGNGGFTDMKAKLNWTFPTYKQIEAGGNWDKMPAELKNMANIQCEVCHGPANEHVTKGAKVMATSMDDGVCNYCHNGGGHHLKGTDLSNSKHSDAESQAFTYAVGNSRQACIRCHSGAGYASFLKNPKDMAAWVNEEQTVGCSTCHDPHSEANVFQLRIVGKPVALPFEAKDVGLSATCYECHNARTKPADAVKGSFPHYSSAAEFMSDTGGVDYGQTVANSPHGMMVGAAPIPNPAAAEDPEAAKFMFTLAGAATGNTPGSCVVCHMWPTIENAKDPNAHKVGSHSFTTNADKFAYTASCKSCHGDLKDFDLPAKADYDGNGKTEGVQTEVKGLLDVLFKAITDAGAKKQNGHPYFQLPTDASEKLKNAIYNFRSVYGVMWGEGSEGNQGKAQAIHNFKRSVMLLQMSYKDLTGKDVPGATLMK